MLNHHCDPSHLYDVITKDRKFIRTLKGSALLEQDIKDAIKGDYVPVSNRETLALAQKIIDKDKQAAINMVLSEENPTHLTYAIGQDLLRRLQQGNKADIETAITIAERMAEKVTGQGQAIQILSVWNRLTPDGALAYAARVAKRNKTKVTPDIERNIREKAGKLRDSKTKNDREVNTGELLKEIAKLEPPSIGKKISTLQTMGQLLTLKTADRNLLGNALFAGAEVTSQTVATALDIAISKITGKRTTTLPNLKVAGAGFVSGGKKGLRDALKGIDTQGGKYDLPQGRVFKNPVLSALETALNIELRATDRAFYEMAYRASVASQLEAARLSKAPVKITPEMQAVAHHDALYKTFQDDSAAAKVFTGIKSGLNKIGIKDFGLGDFVLKYPKTPGNLLARGFDYSPFGIIKTFYELGKPYIDKNIPSDMGQKAFVENFSRVIVGTGGIMTMGSILGGLGLATGEREADQDINSIQKLEGSGSYKLNASGILRYSLTLNPESAKPQKDDVWYSYDWMQPMATPFAAAVNIAQKKTDAVSLPMQAIQGVFEGAETLTEQNVVKGLQQLFSARDDEGKPNVIAGLQNVLASAPASFVPSLLGQINQLADNTVKNTHSPDKMQKAVNEVKAKIPGLAQTLPDRYDVYGQPMERYQDKGNNWFNVLVNPAFVSKLKADPVGQEVLTIYEGSGETKQAPREVQKKIKVKQNGQDVTLVLTGEQIGQYQQQAGQQTKYIFNELVNMPEFSQLSDEGKADIMSGVMTDIHTVAKMALFNHSPSKPTKDVKALKSGRERLYMSRLKGQVIKKLRSE